MVISLDLHFHWSFQYLLILLSIDPDAIRLPVGSNLAAKISPECPVSSITGASSALVLGVYSMLAQIFQMSIRLLYLLLN